MLNSSKDLFHFAKGIINLLIVDDNSDFIIFLKELFSFIPLYAVHSSMTCGDALLLLKSGKRFHLCILDLGIIDVDNDEFYLLRQYAHYCSIIVLTGSDSPSKGAACIQLGAREVIEKGADINVRSFLEIVNYNAIINIINQRYMGNTACDTLSFATKILLEKKPQSVTEWAEQMRISDRQLRNLWHTGSGFSAKHVITMFTFFTQAFHYFLTCIYGTNEEKMALQSTVNLSKLKTYFDAHKEIISFILS